MKKTVINCSCIEDLRDTMRIDIENLKLTNISFKVDMANRKIIAVDKIITYVIPKKTNERG